MSTPEQGSSGSGSNHPKYVIRYTCHGEGDAFAEGIARRRPPSPRADADGEPKVEVAYDRSRHVIQITEPGGETAEFDDRPVRFLVMDRNLVTKALEPVIIRGEPLYYYLAREVGGGKWAVGTWGAKKDKERW
jgi:hypothetical protein